MATEPSTTRPFSLYRGGAKIGSMQDAKIGYKNNASAEPTDGGGVLVAGRVISDVSCNTIMTTEGAESDLVDALIAGTKLTVQIGIVEGGVHAIPMMVSSAEWSGSVKEGKATGAFAFVGLDPDIT